MLKITYNVKSSFDINRIKSYKETLEKRLREASIEIAKIIEEGAKTLHRYQNRTGTLMDATISTYAGQASKHIISTYVDDSKADYGKYILNGFGTWAADPFITDSINRNWNVIMSILNRKINEALEEVFR